MKHSYAYLARKTWKWVFVSSKKGEIFACAGAVGTDFEITVYYYLNIKGVW